MDQGNRIDSRARGNATQMLEKYKKMAHDAQMNGDRVATEYYLQFADHYFRVLADNRARQDEYRRPREDQTRDFSGDYADDEEDGGFGNGHGQSHGGYAREQSEEALARSHQEDDGEERGNRDYAHARQDSRQNEGRQNDGRQSEGRQSEGRQGEGRQGEGRRERRPRDERSEQRGDRASQPRLERQTERADNDGADAPEAAQTAQDSAAEKPRRTLRGRGRPPRSAEAEGSNALDPMILPPAIGASGEAEAPAEAPKPKRRASPRRKAAETDGVAAAAAE
jgi:hypothetical protein